MNADDVMVTMSVRDLRGALRAAARNGIFTHPTKGRVDHAKHPHGPGLDMMCEQTRWLFASAEVVLDGVLANARQGAARAFDTFHDDSKTLDRIMADYQAEAERECDEPLAESVFVCRVKGPHEHHAANTGTDIKMWPNVRRQE